PLIFSTLRSEYAREHHFGSLIPKVNFGLTNANDETPLHLAAAYVPLQTSLPRGFAFPQELINKPDNNHNTPLHWAASTGNVANYQYLIGLGGDPTIPNRWGETPVGILTQQAAKISHLSTNLGHIIDQAVAKPANRRL
ncbi:MAG: ankyrin repeat domain-containing protein, partial [Elusimicrobiaceae bacterium]|nr:ankyrin repeat domain-containing protein [Elusimicrobiaceae bacterium]